MSLSIIENPPKAAWTSKRCYVYAIFSFLVGSAIFACAYIGMHEHSGIGTFNQPTLDWIVKNRQPEITNIMKFITMTASPLILIVFTCIVAAIWAALNREIWRPILLFGATGLAAATSIILKIVIGNGRPPVEDMIKPFETDYSFPSGHTIGTVVLLLVISYLVCSRRPTSLRLFICGVITTLGITIIAGSRLYLGYHWVTDVVASIGLGLIILAIAIIIDRIVVSKFGD